MFALALYLIAIVLWLSGNRITALILGVIACIIVA